jgi:hypothetical protein
VKLFVPGLPPPAEQFELIQALAADEAADRDERPEPLPLPEPIRQLADQLHVVLLLVLDVPPPTGQVAPTHLRAAACASDRVP